MKFSNTYSSGLKDELLSQKTASSFLMTMMEDEWPHWMWWGFDMKDLVIMCQKEGIPCSVEDVYNNTVLLSATHGWQDCYTLDLLLGW